jgi:hypothetical protein
MTTEPPGRVTRRTVLKGLGAGGITVVVAGAGVVSYRTLDNGVLDPGSGRPYEAWDSWRDEPGLAGVVAAAVLAANPHNTQPWRFQVTSDQIDLFSDASRRMPEMDPLLREHHAGIGCALENLLLAAAARGYHTELSLVPESADPDHGAGRPRRHPTDALVVRYEDGRHRGSTGTARSGNLSARISPAHRTAQSPTTPGGRADLRSGRAVIVCRASRPRCPGSTSPPWPPPAPWTSVSARVIPPARGAAC